MRLRPLIHILAVLGVLVHAGALVRHNTAMVGATLEYNALLSDVGSICHGNPDSSGSVGTDFLASLRRRIRMTHARSAWDWSQPSR